MDFKDEIIKSGRLDRFGQPVTGNAERTLHRGIELLAHAQLSSAFEINTNLMLSDNELKEYLSYACGEGEVAENLAGNPIAGFPNVLANARLDFSHANFNAALALRYAGKLYTDNCEKEEHTVSPYAVVNGNMGYAFRSGALAGLALQMHVQNLLDRLYISHGEGADFFPAAERQWFLNAKFEM
jgi:iron complex outermembrane receptor protein